MKKLNTVIFDVSRGLINDLYSVWKADSNAFEGWGLGRIESVERFKGEFKFSISDVYEIMRVQRLSLLKLKRSFDVPIVKIGGLL